jgi:hypothetical protein
MKQAILVLLSLKIWRIIEGFSGAMTPQLVPSIVSGLKLIDIERS